MKLLNPTLHTWNLHFSNFNLKVALQELEPEQHRASEVHYHHQRNLRICPAKNVDSQTKTDCKLS
jgi:hypothetical protein